MFEPNPEQKICIDAIDGVWVVIAGPGSGKTAVLIDRFIKMVSSGIPLDDILNLTFTDSASTEMAKRSGMTDPKKFFRTFHSFCLDLLKKERHELPWRLCDTIIPIAGEDFKLLFELTKRHRVENWKRLREKISEWKRTGVNPDDAVSNGNPREYFYALAYRDYEKESRQQGWLDFDSCIKETVSLLETKPEVRDRHKRKYISVDECQDTDIVQFRLLQLLFDGNIFVVGDENQLIYEWRSAQSGNLTNFSQRFPGAQTLYLGSNYRSTPKLVEFFKKITPVDNGLASHMTSRRQEEGVDPDFMRYGEQDAECRAILARITDPTNTAVIARTNRQLFIFQKICTLNKVKYKILGKKDFWEQNEIKKLLNLAKMSESVEPADRVLRSLIEEHRLFEIYSSGCDGDGDPIANLNDIVKMAANKGTVPEFLAYLRKLTYARKSNQKDSPHITLSTVHQSKGKEWKEVFVIGVTQDRMPHVNGKLDEERRIFFVACTRAADQLHITFSGVRSQFLDDFIDQIAEEADGVSLYQQ